MAEANKQSVEVKVNESAGKDDRLDRLTATLSMLYLLLALAFLSWLLFDTWIERNTFLSGLFRYDPTHERLNSSAFHLIAYTIIGGGLGGVVNGIRSCLIYYHGFGRRYIWKYITAPWMGATLALIVYALIHSSIAVLGGVTTPAVGTFQVLSNFAAGALAGYGSKDVFIWLDAQVHKLFKVTEQVPQLKGKTEEAAASRLHSANLEVGSVTKVPHKDEDKVGTVIEQAPSADVPIDRGDPVDITVATKQTGEQND
jgi:hypothetical protein